MGRLGWRSSRRRSWPRWRSTGLPGSLRVHVLDDGNRAEFRAFAARPARTTSRAPSTPRQGRQPEPRARRHRRRVRRGVRLRPHPGALVPDHGDGLVPARSAVRTRADAGIISSRRIRSSATSALSAACPPRASCSTGWSRTATTCGTRRSSAVPARSCAARALGGIGGIAERDRDRGRPTALRHRTARLHDSAYLREVLAGGLADRACRSTSASACAGRAAWPRSSASTIRCAATGPDAAAQRLVLSRTRCCTSSPACRASCS